MLEFARRVAFGVDVAQFLEFERPFERERIGRAGAEVEHVAGARDQPASLVTGGRERLVEGLQKPSAPSPTATSGAIDSPRAFKSTSSSFQL